jgi:hypothetical protein
MNTAGFIVKNLLVPVVTLVLSYMVYSLDQSVKTFDRQLREREAARLEVSDDRETRFRIYDAVTKSLESPDVRRQQVAQTLVVSMLGADDALRSGLLEVFRTQGATDALKATATVALEESRRFTTQQQAVEASVSTIDGDWRSYSIDVFWCSATGDAARAGAEAVVSTLRAAGAKGRLRVRELPASINASPGYQISGLVIRREIGEQASAAALKQVVDQAYKPRDEFTVMSSRQSTPGYLSLFVCQAD